MQQELTETSNQVSQTNNTQSSTTPSQDGLLRSQQGSSHDAPELLSRSASPGSVFAGADLTAGISAAQLDESLRRLSLENYRPSGSPRLPVAGQRIFDYENALSPATPRQTPRQTLGFRVIRRAGSPSDGVQLTDFPNEILTHILSHLHPDSHGAVALVSKRFYALVTTPYAWRTAFLRYFPGQDVLISSSKHNPDYWDHDESDRVRSEFRYFSRLTTLASWRSEYLLRTRLLRSVMRGKPATGSGGIGTSSRSSQSGKRASAVLTYNSKLPWTITSVHAVFSSGKRSPRVLHGAADLGVATSSDPVIGKVDKWGLDDPFFSSQLDEVVPNGEPYGLDEGPAAVPNVMDVSQPYGMLAGEGFPGGRVYFRATDESRGRYLGPDNAAIIDMAPEIPKIPELSEAVCSVWIAKSSAVVSTTQSMIGILTGSSLGVVTGYSLGHDSTGPRYSPGDMTVRWVLSPGVPIIAIKVDDHYNQRRKLLKRVWAVALNALGEIFYLKETPIPPATRAKGEDAIRNAWYSGRTVYWELVESTRRRAKPDDFDSNALRGAYSPRSPADSMNLSKEQIAAEAQEIEKFLRHKPAYFRKFCDGWDMRRRLEVDFAGGEDTTSGEAIFIIACGFAKGEPTSVTRYSREMVPADTELVGTLEITPARQEIAVPSSMFGGPSQPSKLPSSSSSRSRKKGHALPAAPPPPINTPPAVEANKMDEWRIAACNLKTHATAEITTSSIDMTTFAVMASFEDPLHPSSQGTNSSTTGTPTSKNSTGEIPGRRSRLIAVGTNTGAIILWNTREPIAAAEVNPVRIMQTESPAISCLGVSALYLVHGGADGLVQAWDPLASSCDPIRTLNAKSSGRIPRHIVNANPALRLANYSAVGAIFLDPDPAVLRGVLAFGTFVRFWTYSSSTQRPGRKRRLRHSDIHGRLASRRNGGRVSSYIAAEEAELRHEQEHRSREHARLRNRFGVGLGDLTEEEAIKYAQMISEETFLTDEQRRFSASDTGSAADIGETASSAGSLSADTITPEPSLSGASAPGASGTSLPPLQEETDDDYEAQIQRAIRLSLLEGVNDLGQSPRGNSSGEYEFQVKTKSKKKGGRSLSGSPSLPQVHTPVGPAGESSRGVGVLPSSPGFDPDADLELALRLSLAEEISRQDGSSPPYNPADFGLNIEPDEFPALEVKGKGKGKGY